MKNLQLIYHKENQISLGENARKIRPSTDDDNLTFLATETEIFQINLQNNDRKSIYHTDATKIVDFEHLPIGNELCIATDDGDVIILNIDTLNAESVTYCDGGIETMAWSPTQEVIAFITKTNLLVVMDTNYDPINEHHLDDLEFGCREFITVGWGKKETQFHGTAGKAAAKQQNDAGIMQSSEQLNRNISIVWRGDGELFAVSFVRHSMRLFQVYDKEGKLLFTSEQCYGLEAAIDWRPSGTWIGIPQILPNKYVVTLFEKNGLKHREIVLPFSHSNEEIQRLAWSSDSDILAIETIASLTGKSTIYLYTMCNYHWYIKQTLLFDGKITDFQWDSKFSEGKSLHILLENGSYNMYRWQYAVNHSCSLQPNDDSIVGVIDGKNVLLTNFRQVIIPPPMCATNIQSENYINYIGFIRTSPHPNSFFTIDSMNTLTTYIWESNEFKLHKKYSLKMENSNTIPLSFYHWIWLDEQRFVVSKCVSDGSSVLYLCTLKDVGEIGSIIVTDSLTYKTSIGALDFIQNIHNDKYMIVHLVSGEIFTIMINNQNKFSENTKLMDLPNYCETIRATNQMPFKVFALKHKQYLFLNDTKFASDVTSIFLTEKFLAFTTLDQLKFIRLTDGQMINERQMERGGKLVVIVANDSRTILQMPRGNLEAIQPRLLSLCIIGNLLDLGEYRKAYDIMRRQRINLNLLVDHNPDKFYKEIAQFIDSIDNPHWMNLFLSDLQNSDVTLSMYKSNYTDRLSTNVDLSEKVNYVCQEMIKSMTAKGLYKWFLPIITAHVKNKNIEEALKLISNLKHREQQSAIQSEITANEALKYLIYLVDVNELYNIALGMYDFNIVLFVAQKSQKDPKEYLPFLNELNQLDDLYRKYKIDCHLKRYKKALQHLSKCGVERLDEALELIIKHDLYVDAMNLYREQKTSYEKVTFSFAEYLRTKGKFQDACLMYEKSGDLNQAILSAKHILDWQKCIVLSMSLGSSSDEIKKLVLSLVSALQANGNHIDAANLLLKYDEENYVRALQILCDGHHYSTAIFHAKILDQQLIDSTVKPHLLEYTDLLHKQLQENSDEFQKHQKRLVTLRLIKENRQLNGHPDETEMLDECDLLSETSSMNSSRFTASSRGTAKTHRSSKNRRKHERKLLNLKEGNPFEDIALIDALYNLTIKTYEQQCHVREICKALIELDLNKWGIRLQTLFGGLLKHIKDSLDEIWIPQMVTSGQVPVDGTVDYLHYQDEQHYALIKPQQRFKPDLIKIDWEFEILKL